MANNINTQIKKNIPNDLKQKRKFIKKGEKFRKRYNFIYEGKGSKNKK